MTDVAAAVADLVADRPGFEDDLRELLAVDGRQDAWEYEDIPLDSGQFGEVVARGIAVETDDGDAYRLADPDAVRAALDGDRTAEANEAVEEPPGGPGESVPEITLDLDRRRFESLFARDFSSLTTGSILGAFVLLVVFRLVPFPSVFRGEDVVLTLNDPYYYRYWVERVAADAGGLVNGPVFRELSRGIVKEEPLFVATLWATAELFGTATDAGGILAWYPVLSAVITGALVYLLATTLTDDRRVGVAAVAMLAISPIHALRTSVGFTDHHAFDYLWLILTALAVVVVIDPDRDLRSPAVWGGALALGVGVGGQVLAWEAGPLLLIPLGLFGAVHVLAALRSDEHPAATGAPLLVGVALGSLITVLAHEQLGWHTTVVTYSPALLFVGVTGLYATAEVVGRLGLDHRHMAGIEGVGIVAAAVALPNVFPSFAGRFAGRVEFLLSSPEIAETLSLFAGAFGVLFGPLFRFGFVFFLAIPHLAWFTWRLGSEHRPRWQLVAVYTWFFLLLAVLQTRFAGQLSMFLALFAGLGFVHVLAWVDAARPPLLFDRERSEQSRGSLVGRDSGLGSDERDGDAHRPRSVRWPGRRTVVAIAFVGVLVASMGTIMVVSYTDRATVSEEQYRTATTAAEYADAHGLEYPENYVLSDWSWNRMYNYHVNGEARSYGFARNVYEGALAAPPGQFYERRSGRVGFVVIRPAANPTVTEGSLSAQHRPLFESDATRLPPLEHYRVLRVDRTEPLVLVRLVQGATIRGQAAPNQTYTVATDVELDGETFTFRRTVTTDPNGTYALTVPYPGEYRVDGATVVVSEDDVEGGATVPIEHNASVRSSRNQ
jgi:dolichyl-diphosphooligosaccharide--protein glycosyltransferase